MVQAELRADVEKLLAREGNGEGRAVRKSGCSSQPSATRARALLLRCSYDHTQGRREGLNLSVRWFVVLLQIFMRC